MRQYPSDIASTPAVKASRRRKAHAPVTPRPSAGAEPYKRDLKTSEFHLLDTGHFALEEEGDRIADLMRQFVRKHTATKYAVRFSPSIRGGT